MAAEVARIEQARVAAQVCATAADTAAAAAVDRRIEHLQAEGHGPQRHEGDPTLDALGERAVYRIDPETQTQLDAESGTLHGASTEASKFRTKTIYVRAEAIARAALVAGADTVSVPLSTVGANVAMGITCTARPATRPTTLGAALRVPTLPAYVDDGTSPPPTRAQMDLPAMQVAVAGCTQPTVFAANAEVFAVLRTDTHGQVYLRTMWPQNPPPPPP
jgi:hypothetical protein